VPGNARDLSTLSLPTYINTRKEDVIEKLYKPCLKNSVRYVRGAGFFRSSVFRLMTEELLEFCINGGEVSLLTSTEWGRDDYETAINAYRDYEETGFKEDLETLFENPHTVDPARMLCALIQNGKLSLSIAVLRGDIYHQKKGYFEDEHSNIVSFDGSGNETLSALKPYDEGNAESFSIGWSWDPLSWNMYGRVWKEDLDQTFDPEYDSTFPVVKINQLDPAFIGKWDIDPDLKSHRDAARNRQRKIRAKWDEIYGKESPTEGGTEIFTTPPFDIPDDLYNHQKRGVKYWQKAGKRGILEYATGSGKTITAIAAIKEHVESGNNSIILVPSEHLLFQWYEEVEKFIPQSSIGMLGGGEKEDEMLNEMRFPRGQGSILISIIHSFRSSKVQRKLTRLLRTGQNILLVVDECHRIGAPSYSEICEQQFPLVLGLSATPDVQGRPEYNERIRKLLGKTLDEYSLKNALKDGHLSPFEFHIHKINLTNKEQEEYDKLRAKIKKSFAMLKKGEPLPEQLEKLIYMSRGIIRGAENKITQAAKLLKSEFKEGQHWLIYCDNESMMRKLGNKIKEEKVSVIPRYYWSGMNRFERKSELDFFKRNGGVIIAIKCLDEGVDVPAISHGIVLSSSKTKREWIQRRGRLLRKSEGKEKSVIHDVLAFPSGEGQEISFVVDEVKRAKEFSESCLNSISVEYEIEKLCREYHINLDLVLEDEPEVFEDDE